MVLLNCFESPEIGVFDRREPRKFLHFDSCGQDTQKRQVMASSRIRTQSKLSEQRIGARD